MSQSLPIVTVTLNPAIDRTLSIDGFEIGKVNRVLAEQSHAAGKGVNVATMLADLGERVVASGFLGEDNLAIYQALFAQRGIDDQFVSVAGATRVGLKIIDRAAGGRTTDINFPGLTPPADAIDSLIARIRKLATRDRWFVFSGSVPAGMRTDIYSELIALVHAAGGRVLLDTSGIPFAEALRRSPDVVKPNVAELSEFIGESLDGVDRVVRAARSALIEKGVTLAVVSMGGDGAVFVDGRQALLAAPPKVNVQSTVGAGDAMVAGIMMGVSRGWPLMETAMLASSLGTYAVTRVAVGLEAAGAYRGFEPLVTVIA
jgi:1-phosphofructokinase family hexose kinase